MNTNEEKVINILNWSDEVADQMTDDDWNKLHTNDSEVVEIFG